MNNITILLKQYLLFFIFLISLCQISYAEWIYCAKEGESCSFNGTKKVKYGLNSSWYEQTHTDGVQCSNSVFGDPLVGALKYCYYFQEEDTSEKKLDLSSWTAYTYDLSGGQAVGKWVLSDNKITVIQKINADPSFFLNNINQTSYKMDGSFRVKTTGDDDFIGFVFGYQNDHQFYIFDWKQTTQNANGYGLTNEGFRILKIDADSRNDLTLYDFWQSNTANSTILASSFGDDKGWEDNKFYDFHLEFSPGTFTVVIYVGGTDIELWNITIDDDSYNSGQFGFYNFSQENVEYSGFEQTGGVVQASVSGCIELKDEPVRKGKAMLMQSGEIFQSVPLDEKGCYKFFHVNEDKPFGVMIRRTLEK